jgi:hypothetical protein
MQIFDMVFFKNHDLYCLALDSIVNINLWHTSMNIMIMVIECINLNDPEAYDG